MKIPTGNITLLFAEVDHGEAPLENMPDFHIPDSSLREALLYVLHAQNGYIISIDEDSIRAAFSSPEEALTVAVAIEQIFHAERRKLATAELSVVQRFRVALHTGRAQIEEGHYVGETVAHVGPLLAAGHGGQILVSAECAHALQNRWPAGVRLLNLGKFRYAGQDEPEAVFQVSHADLLAEFPPLRLAGASPTNLPLAWTSFVGRTTESVALKRSLSSSRILTLIGSAGIGKSRLATALASDMRGAFPDGVWFTELPSVSDAEIVPGAIAWALGAKAGGETSLTAGIIALLRDKKALLVLDAGESNLPACARLVTALLAACPGIKCVVCARKGLGLRDEAIYCVPALNSFEREGGSDAIQLCRERAAQLASPVDLDEPLLTELCSLLNSLPLALELAIGGLASQSAASLEDLVESLRDLIQGQQLSWEQTLQCVLDWAYQRLTEPEQILLERLSVFQSGWSLEAATAVCCDEFLPSDLLPTLLESLRACAFIAAEQRAGFARECLRDAVRHDAEARLSARGEAAEFRRRHAEYFTQLAEQGALGLTGPDSEGWKVYVEREYLNLRAALLSLRQEAAEGAHGVRLATALLPLCAWWGRPAEGNALVARTAEANRASGLENYSAARSRFFTAIERCHTAGDGPNEVRYLTSLARLALSQSDFTTAMQSYEQAVVAFRELGDQAQEARTLHCLGSAARDGGEYAIAQQHYERALELNRSLGHRQDEAHNLNALARLALLQNDAPEATERFQEGLILFRALGERAWEAHNMGQILRLSLPSEPLWERSAIHAGTRT